MNTGGDLLVGRDVQLRMLTTLIADARRGRGRAVLLSGEAGIGKTALAAAFAVAAGHAGLAVTWGRCPDSEAPAFWPWVQAFRGLQDGADTIFEARSHGERVVLFASVVEVLERTTAARPAVVVLEDLHWADASSLALLRFVVGAVPGMSLVLALTARDDPLEIDESSSATLSALPPAVMRVPLEGLDREAVATVVTSIVGAHASPELVAGIHDRTAGNPFFVTEVARLHAVRGTGRAIDLPPGVHQVLSRRLARLSQPASELLGAAAVVGEPDIDLLAGVTGRPADEVRTLLDQAVRARVVVQHESAYLFAHALVRETLCEDLSSTARSRLHRRVAEVLEARSDAQPGDLALHWARSGGDHARRRAAECALDAARVAMAGSAYELAVRHFRRALEGGADDRIAASIGLGEAQVLAGDLGGGRQTLREAAEASAAGGRAEDLARAVLAMGTGVGGFEVDVDDERQSRLLHEALASLPQEDGSLRAAVMARLSLADAGRATPDARSDMTEAAVQMARRVGDTAVEVSALAAACDALAGPDHVADRLAATDTMIRLAEASGHLLLVLLARRLRLVALLERGDLPGVDAEIAAYARVSDRLRLPLYAWPVPIWRGMRAAMEGDLDTAWRCSEQAEELGRQADSVNAELMVFTLRLAVCRARGTPGDLLPFVRERIDDLERLQGASCMLAALFTEAGHPDVGRRHLRRILDRGLEALPRDSEWIEYVWFLGDAAMLLDEREAARIVHDALSPYASLWAVDGMGGACFGPVSRQLERLAAFLGRPRPAAIETVEGTFHREGRLWRVRFRGHEAVVPDSKGMGDLATLLARPGREVHVLDLLEVAGGPPAGAAGRDTGPVLDAAARTAYRTRLVELEDEIATADSHADTARAERLRMERDLIAAELAGALGLGGRPRTAGDRVERARKAVTMRIATALRTIEAAHPALGRHLRVAVTTGRFCTYRPEQPAAWKV